MSLVILLVAIGLVVLALAPLLVTRVRGGRGGRDADPGLDAAAPGARTLGRPGAAAPPLAPPDDLAATREILDDTRDEVARLDETVADLERRLQEAETLGTPPPGETLPAVAEEPVVAPKPRFRDRLTKARALIGGYIGSVLSRGSIDAQTWEELEEALIRADVGVTLTGRLLGDLQQQVKAQGITEPAVLLEAFKSELKGALDADRHLTIDAGLTNVWLFVGVNGVGKTTTIGKIGHREAAAGRSIVMAAGDTFRAAAADQLELWAKRANADLVRGAEGGDPASVIFDAIQRASARNAHLVLADTAGRLHTKVNLMEELKKVRRIAERPPGHVSEVLLVIDATTGQNGIVQAREFADAVGVTGVVLTKLDSTAKGGIALAIQLDLGIPIKLVGLGESAEDLVDFDPDEFVEALLSP